MWSYYGTKKRIAKEYPLPINDIIIEPFAGAAQYSLYGDNWKKDVYLIDKYPVIIDVWKYLISASKEDILKLPNMEKGDKVDDHKQLIDAEKYLIGFCINNGSTCPKKTTAKYNSWNRTKLYIADNLYKIKHWKVKCDEYYNLKNVKATWFIDPPYQYGGEYYRFSNKNINYNELGKWCKERKGQIIVCENTKADWMDFKPLVEMHGQLHTTTEAIWYKENN